MPEAATSPIGPGGTEFENPRPMPPTIVVPQSGPSTSRPRRAAMSFSATSWPTGTLSEKIITSQPASSASIASANTCWPGTEISTRPGPSLRIALRTVRGGESPAACPAGSPGRSVSAASITAEAAASDSLSAALIAISRSLGPIVPACPWPAGMPKPRSASSSRFSSVAVATSAACTPSTALALALTCMSVTESA